MAELEARLRGDLTVSRKAQDKPRTLLLGTVIADVMNRAIELGRDPSDDETAEVLRRALKKRREALEAFERAGRTDLADKERAEATMLEHYLPAQATDDEIRAAVAEAIGSGAATLGAVMGQLVPKLRGRAEGARINSIAREELSRRA